MSEVGHTTPRGSPLFLIGSMAVIVVGATLGLLAVVPFATCEDCLAVRELMKSPHVVVCFVDPARPRKGCSSCANRDKMTLLQYWECTCRKAKSPFRLSGPPIDVPPGAVQVR